MGKDILIGLSGGVDSAASVILLKNEGWNVSALYFDVQKSGNEDAYMQAKAAAKRLGIPLIYRNVADAFEEKVISYFCNEYCNGRTPSPCVVCNPSMKLRVLCDEADRLGIEKIATGHYCGILEDAGIFYPTRAKEQKKDQSYMLCRVPQNILSRIVFPLQGVSDKRDVRELACSFELENAKTKDSQDLCFITGDYKDFLKARGLSGISGVVKTSDGRVLRTHDGIHGFTLGQRKGLGIAAGKPVFVTSIDSESGDVIVGESESLFRKKVCIKDLFFMKYGRTDCIPGEVNNNKFMFKLRYTAKEASGLLTEEDGIPAIIFDEPQRAPTPGQFAAIYDGERLIGSGVIES